LKGDAVTTQRDVSIALACPLEVIGVVRTQRSAIETRPVQAALNRSERGSVEIYERFVEGLQGLDGFDYAWLVSWLHRPHVPARKAPLTQIPYLLRPQQRQMGIFATRGPRRVNPLGLSLVQLLDVSGAVVTFAGVDLLDGTPVIDLKPYVTRFDRPAGEPRCGWFDTVPLPDGVTPADLDRDIPTAPHEFCGYVNDDADRTHGGRREHT
jgi:tRNA-Thr(GGU) m(6)t(6)A37 methyltransferase TsaA